MLTWEYPPRNIGGLANHTYFLAGELGRSGHEIHVVTCNSGTEEYEYINNVHIHRVIPYQLDDNDFPKWVMHLNFSMLEKCIELFKKQHFDIIHSHDWLVAYTSKALKNIYNVPIVCTIHSTEHGRNNGIWSELHHYIHSVECMLVADAARVIVCSDFMKSHTSEILKVPIEKITVVVNGIEIKPQLDKETISNFRVQILPENEKSIFYIGRHVFEKGIHLLIKAMPQIIEKFNNVKLIVGGVGPMTYELKELTKQLRIEDKVIFNGYMDEITKQKLYSISSVAVFPSLFEPFGIVALEAMASGCAVVVSDTGGFSEIVTHRINGMKARVGSSDSLAENIIELLGDEALRNSVSEKAISELPKYTWPDICIKTHEVYNNIINKKDV